MKKLRRLTAVLLSVLLVITIPAVTADAITVVKDGKSYTLKSVTPTTGDCNVLVIRVGFADYPVDGQVKPAHSEETLLSYFDGSGKSINGYYEASSYGKLRLHCEKVYSYNAQSEREHYKDGNTVSEELLNETLNALKDEIDAEKYDSDGDGNLDFVCFDYAGPSTGWGTAWWSYVFSPDNVAINGKRVPMCTFLLGNLNTYIHEFGHILGMPDYYSTTDNSITPIMTFDMMSNNQGDHNGFSKWCYGWLTDDEIAFVDKAAGDTTVTLSPIETGLDGGKKIAVVAPSFSSETRFLDEYFLVEYDSGQGNNKVAFEQNATEPGFRIFHVNAAAEYNENRAEATFSLTNNELRSNLIHNMKNELEYYPMLNFDAMFFREGDKLTPLDYPNTGFATGRMYNGQPTGISFTDFVTGDNPSFKVSFSDEPAEQPEPKLTLETEELDSAIKMNLSSDVPLSLKSRRESDYEAPYLIDADGTVLTLDVTQSFPQQFRLGYQNLSPAVQPDTEYTLVIPEGLFFYGYEKKMPEFRQVIKTNRFLAQTVIERYRPTESGKRISNVFAVTANTYGRIVLDADTSKCDFIEFNLNGEEIGRTAFDAPDYGGVRGQRLFRCGVYTLDDGSFAFCVYTLDNSYFTKIDRSGKSLSRTFIVTDDMVKGYANGAADIRFETIKGGLRKRINASDYSSAVELTIDFENEPTMTTEYPDEIFPLNGDYYLCKSYQDGKQFLQVYDAADQELSEIVLDDNMMGAFIKDGNLHVLSKEVKWDENSHRITTVRLSVYEIGGRQLSSQDITGTAVHLGKYDWFERMIPTDSGYFLIPKSYDDSTTVIACDREWNNMGKLSFDENHNMAFLGECGLACREQYDKEAGQSFVYVSRFNIGDFEIVPKPKPLLGDANRDGVVNIDDATAIQRRIAELSDASFDETAADIDGNGLNINDATLIQMYLADIPVSYPIGKLKES